MQCSNVRSFRLAPKSSPLVWHQKKTLQRSTKALGMLPSFDLIIAAEAVKPDGYVYGSVAAPDWALPVGCFLAILTAAIPFLLRPGEAVSLYAL